MVNRKTSGALYRIPTLVLLLGMLSVALLIWTHEITETQRENFALVDALEHIQKRTFMFHLRLEEAISGDTKVAMDSLWGEIDDAMRVADAILNGGEVVMGLTIQRLPNPHQRAAVAEIAVALNNFKSVALQRYQRTQFGEIHSEVEQHFHDAFQEAWNKTGRFETEAEMDYVAAHASSRRLFWAILLVWTSVVVGSTVGLWSRERRRRWAETELRTANERLESQAEELRRNREQLQDLVEERTGELTTANRELRREIDERTQVEGVLRESEGKFRKLSREFNALLDAIPDRITLLAPDLKILWANRAAVQGAGSQVSDVTWHPCYKVWHGLAAPCDDCPAARSFSLSHAITSWFSAWTMTSARSRRLL